MSEQNITRTGQIAIVLAVLTAVLAFSAVLIKYVRSGEIEIAPIALGIIIPALVISIVMSKKSKR